MLRCCMNGALTAVCKRQAGWASACTLPWLLKCRPKAKVWDMQGAAHLQECHVGGGCALAAAVSHVLKDGPGRINAAQPGKIGKGKRKGKERGRGGGGSRGYERGTKELERGREGALLSSIDKPQDESPILNKPRRKGTAQDRALGIALVSTGSSATDQQKDATAQA